MGLQTEIAKIIFNIDPPLFVEWEQETDYVKEASCFLVLASGLPQFLD